MAPNLHVKSADGYPVAIEWLSTKLPFFRYGYSTNKASHLPIDTQKNMQKHDLRGFSQKLQQIGKICFLSVRF